ncbi:unnamed protein product [Ixodes hexagonus]
MEQGIAPDSTGDVNYCKACKQDLNGIKTVELPSKLVNEKQLLVRPEFLAVEGERPVCRMANYSVFSDAVAAVRNVYRDMDPAFTKNVTVVYDGTWMTRGHTFYIGPIFSWGDSCLAGPEQNNADYYLGEEASHYTSLMQPLRRKICLTKVVVEAVANNPSCSYEELVGIVQGASVWGEGDFTEEELRRDAHFVMSQVCSYDFARDHGDEKTVLSAPCLQSLVNLRRMSSIRGNRSSDLHSYRKPEETLATCTPVVQDIMSQAFQGQMAGSSPARRASQNDRAATCVSCSAWKQTHFKAPAELCGHVVQSASISKTLVSCGAYIFAKHPNHCCPRVGRVMSLFERRGQEMAHLQWFCYSSETVLGNTADRHEIFMVNSCGDVQVDKIYGTCPASQKLFFKEWFEEGGKADVSVGSEKGYYFSKLYHSDIGRFEDVPTPSREPGTSGYVCYTCRHNSKKLLVNDYCLGKEVLTDKDGNTFYSTVRWKRKCYRVGDCVFLSPGTFAFDLPPGDQPLHDAQGSSKKPTPPFQVGCIDSIFSRKDFRVFLKCKIPRFRPEDTHLGRALSYESDLNLLYYSDEVACIDMRAVQGKASVVFEESPQNVSAGIWCIGDTFVFSQMYCAEKRRFCAVPVEAQKIGSRLKNHQKRGRDMPRLRTLEAFAGCGGE